MESGGWTWGQLPNCKGVLVREYAYNAHECRALVHSYGRMAQHMIGRRKLGDRFSIYAKGPMTGLTVGLREWAWSPAQREYEPVGEYMCGWRVAIRTHWTNTGENFERRRFDPRPGPLLPIPLRDVGAA
jgi:hypothetical protein